MNDRSIKNIIKKIINVEATNIERLRYEDNDGFYNVWKIKVNTGLYLLKKTSINELNNYLEIKSDNVPKLYGYIKYYNKIYILIEYIIGTNLTKSTRNNIIKTIDAIIHLQKQYWNSSAVIGIKFEEKIKSVKNRKEFLFDDILEKAYNKFIDLFLSCDKTIVHDDLLPFNVIVNDETCKIIDLEYVGVLPYPLTFCRLITHCKEEKDYIFYMSEEDKQYAIEYYYNNFIKFHNINYMQYIKTIRYFMFYEFTEWVFVYNKYQKQKDQMFEYYYSNSKKIANEILEEIYD